MKCKICGKRFKMQKENKYLVKAGEKEFEGLIRAAKVFEAFDCPQCGCQNIVNIREGSHDWRREEKAN